jgi:hypothetical protein
MYPSISANATTDTRRFGGAGNVRSTGHRSVSHEAQVRATYGAVAELVGGIARGIGARLTVLYSRSPEASWVVSAETGMPTGYALSERHPALLNKSEIIRSGRELEQRMTRWQRTR